MMLTFVCATLALTSWAEPSTGQDPRDLLRQAAAAGKRLQSVRYVVQTSFGGQPVEATVLEQRAASGGGSLDPSKYIIRVKWGERSYRYSYDGSSFRLAEGPGGNVEVIAKPTDYELGQALGRFPMVQMPMFGALFQQVASSAELVYKGTKQVEGKVADVVEVRRKVMNPTRGEVTITSTFAFDRQTKLPVESISPGMPPKRVTALELNPSIPRDAFHISGTETFRSGTELLSKSLLPVGTLAPDFTLKDPQGRAVSLRSLRGKVVLLDFWGTWCAPCLAMMPKLQALHQNYKSSGLEVIGISVADKENDPAGLMRRRGFTYRLLLDGDATARRYQAERLPTLYLIDRSGRIAYRQSGASAPGDDPLQRALQKLLGAPR